MVDCNNNNDAKGFPLRILYSHDPCSRSTDSILLVIMLSLYWPSLFANRPEHSAISSRGSSVGTESTLPLMIDCPGRAMCRIQTTSYQAMFHVARGVEVVKCFPVSPWARVSQSSHRSILLYQSCNHTRSGAYLPAKSPLRRNNHFPCPASLSTTSSNPLPNLCSCSNAISNPSLPP